MRVIIETEPEDWPDEGEEWEFLIIKNDSGSYTVYDFAHFEIAEVDTIAEAWQAIEEVPRR